MELVVNIRTHPFDTYIGRGSRWGNPYRISPTMDRAEVIKRYRAHLWWQIQTGAVTLDDLLALEGQVLGCYCKPADCHGDVIVKAISWAREQWDALLEAENMEGGI